MAIDNTHTKYLKGSDKKAWEGYKDAYKAQKNLESFISGFGVSLDLKEGEEIDIPVRKTPSQAKKTKK